MIQLISGWREYVYTRNPLNILDILPLSQNCRAHINGCNGSVAFKGEFSYWIITFNGKYFKYYKLSQSFARGGYFTKSAICTHHRFSYKMLTFLLFSNTII